MSNEPTTAASDDVTVDREWLESRLAECRRIDGGDGFGYVRRAIVPAIQAECDKCSRNVFGTERCAIVEAVVSALAEAGIVHPRLKPANPIALAAVEGKA